jgi:NAD(P)-dependent dehydrogenase (short-subunit alcohol dehydrogenase family)
VITGADSGIGRAVAIEFAREGADVVVAYLDAENDNETGAWSRSRDVARSRSRTTSETSRIAGD